MSIILLTQLSALATPSTSMPVGTQVSVWTNRVGKTVRALCSAITNQTVYLTLPSGRARALPLAIFPENEQLRMKLLLGVAPVPRCILPAWRLFESQLASALDVESTRAVLGFMVKQVKKQADENAVSRTEEKYWVARAVKKERAVRRVLLKKKAQSGLQNKVSGAQQLGEK